MSKLSTIEVTAQVFDDGMLGVKIPTGLWPRAYDGVLVLRRRDVRAGGR